MNYIIIISYIESLYCAPWFLQTGQAKVLSNSGPKELRRIPAFHMKVINNTV